MLKCGGLVAVDLGPSRHFREESRNFADVSSFFNETEKAVGGDSEAKRREEDYFTDLRDDEKVRVNRLTVVLPIYPFTHLFIYSCVVCVADG